MCFYLRLKCADSKGPSYARGLNNGYFTGILTQQHLPPATDPQLFEMLRSIQHSLAQMAPPPGSSVRTPSPPHQSSSEEEGQYNAPSIKRIVTRGFHWTWLSEPPPGGSAEPRLDPNAPPDLLEEVQALVTRKAVYEVPLSPATPRGSSQDPNHPEVTA